MQECYQEGMALVTVLKQNMQQDSNCAHAMKEQPMQAQMFDSIAAKRQLAELTGDETSTPTSSAASPMAL